MLNPSFVSDDCIEFYKILDGNSSFYFTIYGFFNNSFTNGMKWRILIVGINKDIGINQICGQDVHRRDSPCQMPLLLCDRDGRLVSLKVSSFLPFVMVCFFSSNVRQNLISLQPVQGAESLRCLLSFFVFQLLLALFQPSVYRIYLKISRKDKFSQYDYDI